MAVYIVTGNLGAGKSLCMMGKMRDYLWEGKRVATNVNVRVEHLVSGKAPRNILRTPDQPPAEFLWDVLGLGSDSRNEKTFGMLLLDEVGTWLNAREWKGNERQRVIEWFIHSRKRRWDCYLLAQSINMIDKQVREAIGEHVVFCRRFDRMTVPLIGPLIAAAGGRLPLPQVHVAAVRYCAGMSINTAPTVARWFYSGRDLWGSYDTSQRFDASNDGCASMLSPDKYPWLRKPMGIGFTVQEWLEKRDFHRLAALVDRIRPISDLERQYRYLQVCDNVPESLHVAPVVTFEDYFSSHTSITPDGIPAQRSGLKWGVSRWQQSADAIGYAA